MGQGDTTTEKLHGDMEKSGDMTTGRLYGDMGKPRGHDYRKTPWGHREDRGNLGQVLSSQPQKQLMDTLIDTLLPEL